MDKIKKYQHIARLIYKQQISRIHQAEADELQDWLDENNTNNALHKKLTTKEYAKDIEFYNKVDSSLAWQKYNQKYSPKRKINRIAVWSAAAACFIGAIILSLLFTDTFKTSEVATQHAIIQPGTSKAILILNNGKSIDLSSSKSSRIFVSETAEAQNSGSQINYSGKEDMRYFDDEKEVFNEIVVPRGGEYKIILSDGSHVWLNSETKLKYPVKFTKDTRNVYLEGEAFFEVARDSRKPFFVHLENEAEVRVLGTAFNVRSYSDEDIMETVLEKGSIEMQFAEQDVLLTPSFKVEYHKKTKEISEKKVDTELYTAWKDGRYVFYNESLENILHKLSRWYDIDVVFKDEAVKKMAFNGNVRKYENVNVLLDALQASGGVRFEISGKKVMVSKAN